MMRLRANIYATAKSWYAQWNIPVFGPMLTDKGEPYLMLDIPFH